MSSVASVEAVETTLGRLSSEYESVQGIVVVNEHGFPLHAEGSTGPASANVVASGMNEIAHLARNLVRDVDPEDDLVFLRLRCGKAEWVVGAKDDHLVVVRQNLRKLYSDIAARGGGLQVDEDPMADMAASTEEDHDNYDLLDLTSTV